MSSHPVRVRRLKLVNELATTGMFKSHPVRVRRLKPVVPVPKGFLAAIASCTGAQIETLDFYR